MVCSDRWSVYDRLSPFCRQVCWAGPKRDFQKLVDRGGAAAPLGRRLQRVAERVFVKWHLFRGGGCDRQELQRRLDGPAHRLERALKAGRQCAYDSKAATLCANVLALLPAVWRFVVSEGVEPTNNHAERVLRHGVLWRKNAFGCQSEAGCRFVERMLTVVQARRLQGRSVLDYLYDALVAGPSQRPPRTFSTCGRLIGYIKSFTAENAESTGEKTKECPKGTVLSLCFSFFFSPRPLCVLHGEISLQ